MKTAKRAGASMLLKDQFLEFPVFRGKSQPAYRVCIIMPYGMVADVPISRRRAEEVGEIAPTQSRAQFVRFHHPLAIPPVQRLTTLYARRSPLIALYIYELAMSTFSPTRFLINILFKCDTEINGTAVRVGT